MRQLITTLGRDLGLWRRLLPYQMHQIKYLLRDDPYTDVLHRRSSIFIHVPRTGGTSVTAAFFDGTLEGHFPYFLYERRDRAAFNKYFKFSFVRNPWDRVLSAYLYLYREDQNEPTTQWRQKNLAHLLSFNQFVREWLNEKSIWSHYVFMPQSYFIVDRKGRCKVDFIGRHENREADIRLIGERLGVDRALPHLNGTSHPHYTELYDDETRAIVHRVYARDVEYFGYKFED